MADHLAAVTQVQSSLIDAGLKFGPRLLVALAIVVVGYYVARASGRLAHRMLARFDIDVTVRQLLVRCVSVLVQVLFLIMALQNLGVEILPLVAGLGVAGAGAALAMQGVLSNLAAGLTIVFTRPFTVGEYISIAGEEGTVEEISLFSTVLLHTDLSRIVIPNRKIAGEILHNYGRLRQLDLGVSVAYGNDISLALVVLQDVLARSAVALKDPSPVVQVLTLNDSSARIALRPWVKVEDFVAANGELNLAMVDALRRSGIAVAAPRRDVRMLTE